MVRFYVATAMSAIGEERPFTGVQNVDDLTHKPRLPFYIRKVYGEPLVDGRGLYRWEYGYTPNLRSIGNLAKEHGATVSEVYFGNSLIAVDIE